VLEIVKHKTEDIISLLENLGYYLINEQKKHEYAVYKKADGSILTELDIASEYIIKSELNGLFGDVKILSEENTNEENKEIVKNKYFFLLDPIDGTNNFNKGGEFTINLSFCENRLPVFSFIHNPIRKTLIFGDKEQSFKRYSGKITKLQKINGADKYDLILNDKQKQLKLVVGKHNFNSKEYVDSLIKNLQQCGYYFTRYNLKSASAMGKLLSFVNLEADGFLTANCCNNWDVLPAVPILKSINAYTNMDNCKVFENNNFSSGTFIVANSESLFNDLVDVNEKLPKNFIIECK